MQKVNLAEKLAMFDERWSPRVEHCPKAEVETHLLLIEPRGTVNTGDVGGALTATEQRA
jgi:hypothetical protein